MIVIRQPNGKLRLMADGEELKLQPGENIMRRVEDTTADEFVRAGIKWGDVVAWAATKAGVKQCGACRARQASLNKIRELGVAEAIRQIKETLGK